MSVVRGLITLTLLVLFVRLTIWAWSARRKPLFDSLAQLPLVDDADDAAPCERRGTAGRSS